MTTVNFLSKYAIYVGWDGSVFVKEYDYFCSQGGAHQSWGRNWKIVEASSIEEARVLAIKEPGARAGLYCGVCGHSKWEACAHIIADSGVR